MKAKMYCLALLASALVLVSGNVRSQEADLEESNLSIGAEVYNRYVWRGLNLGGNTMSIQPGIEYAFGNSGLAIGAWGAFSMGGQTVQEVDLYVSYSPVDEFTITITDYFFPDDFGGDDYFNYGKDSTSHLFEAALSFNGTESLPLSATFAINFYGDDARKANGDMLYSTYLELAYSFELKGGYGLDLFAGATLTKPDEGVGGFYGDKAGLINLGLTVSKELPISETFSLPLTSSLIVNPESKGIFLVFGFAF